MIRNFISKIIPFTVLPLAVYTVSRLAFIPMGNITFWWLVQTVILLFFFWEARYSFMESETRRAIRIVKLYLVWNAICIIRGMFLTENYWDWKGLISNSFGLLAPIVAYTSSNKESLQSILAFYIRCTLPMAIVIFPVVAIDIWGSYLIPLSFLILFIPALWLRWKAFLVIISIALILAVLSARATILFYGTPILLVLFFYYLQAFPFSTKIMELSRKVFLLIPWIFFLLAVFGIFNIFKIGEDSKGEFIAEQQQMGGGVYEEDLSADTRTFLFEEVLLSSKKYNSWLIGRSPARGHQTSYFADNDVTGRSERLRDEVAVLNVFTWTGIVGVTLYFLIFCYASWLAVNRSNNIYSKLIGLFVAFRWILAWIGDIANLDLSYFTIWLMIGICFSKSFREMDNAEVKLWVRGIFNKRYLNKYRYYLKTISAD